MKVYGIVEMIRLYIQYEEDNSIEEQLTKLSLEGNETKRSKQEISRPIPAEVREKTTKQERTSPTQMIAKGREAKLITKTQII